MTPVPITPCRPVGERGSQSSARETRWSICTAGEVAGPRAKLTRASVQGLVSVPRTTRHPSRRRRRRYPAPAQRRGCRTHPPASIPDVHAGPNASRVSGEPGPRAHGEHVYVGDPRSRGRFRGHDLGDGRAGRAVERRTPAPVPAARMRQTADVLEMARSRGLPVARHELTVELDHGVVAVVRERLAGNHAARVDVDVIDALVSVNDRFAGLLADRPDVPIPPLNLSRAEPSIPDTRSWTATGVASHDVVTSGFARATRRTYGLATVPAATPGFPWPPTSTLLDRLTIGLAHLTTATGSARRR